jgi:hypothetical protein
MPRIPKLLTFITFHYSDRRVPLLKQTCSRIAELAETVDVVVLTNEQAKIPYLLGELDASGYGLKILAPELLGHPYLLTWCYQKVFRDHLNADKSPSRFMYIEGDIIITPENI